MAETTTVGTAARLRGPNGRPLRVAHLTTVDMSLALLLQTELEVDVASGLEVLGISADGPYSDRLAGTGVTHVTVPSLTRSWSLRRDARAVRELLATVRRHRPDVLHTHTPKAGVMGRLVGRAAGVPVVVNTCHGLWAQPHDRLVRRVAVYGAEVVAALASDAELYQNAADLETLTPWVRRRKATVVGNGTDLLRFRPVDGLGAAVRAGLGIRPDELVVGGVGRLVAEKGVAEFAEAARRLSGKARFVWFGPADASKPDAVSPEDHHVIWAGEHADMPAVYNALDVFVLPSYREGFSRSAMEAAACAVPSVLSDIRGCREIGTHDREVLLVPPGDAVALAGEVERLLLDVALRQSLGAAARARAVDEFDQRRVAATSIATYAAVARRKGLGWTDGGAR